MESISARSFDRPLRKAFGISLLINSVMGAAGAIGNASGLTALSYVSTIIAAPTAFLVGWMLKPKGQSIGEIAFAGVEALVFSICFYTLVLWLVLRFWPRERPLRTGDSKR